jgi:hypothetical protein
LTGRGNLRVRRVRLCRCAKSWLMIIPSAPLSRRAEALISLADRCPTRDTLSVTEGDLILRMVPLGTGSESRVSKREILRTSSGSYRSRVLQYSAFVGRSRNPSC